MKHNYTGKKKEKIWKSSSCAFNVFLLSQPPVGLINFYVALIIVDIVFSCFSHIISPLISLLFLTLSRSTVTLAGTVNDCAGNVCAPVFVAPLSHPISQESSEAYMHWCLQPWYFAFSGILLLSTEMILKCCSCLLNFCRCTAALSRMTFFLVFGQKYMVQRYFGVLLS